MRRPSRAAALGSVGVITAAVVSVGLPAVYSGAGADTRAADPSPLYYVDPMHPSYKSARPGTAPDCGMDLVPVYPQPDVPGRTEDRAVQVSDEQQRLLGATLAAAEWTTGPQTLRVTARVAADESRLYSVTIGISGVASDVSEVTTGTLVTRGQWLATVSAPEARTTMQGYLIALDAANGERAAAGDDTTVTLAAAGLRQAHDRLRTLGMSDGQIADLRRTRVVPPTIDVTSPASGIVTARVVSRGERIDAGAELFRIADLERIWIVADLFGLPQEFVRTGATAHVTAPHRRDPLSATVSTGSVPEFDPATQSVQVRLEADNPSLALRPGMLVDVMLPLDLPDAVTVPATAVIESGPDSHVIVEDGVDSFISRRVGVAWRFGDRVAIASGLTVGERVVTDGAFLIDAANRLRRDAMQ